MKSFKIFAIVAACVLSAASIPSFAQSAAKFKKGGVQQADCVYTDLSVVGGELTVNCTTDVNYTGGSTTPPGGPYTLTAIASPLNSGSVTSASCSTGSSGGCNGSVAAGTSVTLTAAPTSGNTFAGWQAGGPCSGTSTTCTFTMNSSVTVTANFNTGSTAPPPPPGCSGLTPTSNYEARTSMGPAGQTTIHYGKAGITYSYPLPSVSPAVKGIIATTSYPTTPGGMLIEVSISECPGDMSYYNTAAARYTYWGSLQTPCGSITNPESGGVKFALARVTGDIYCVAPTITPTNTWYFNIRYTAGCEGGASCPMVVSWNRQF